MFRVSGLLPVGSFRGLGFRVGPSSFQLSFLGILSGVQGLGFE